MLCTVCGALNDDSLQICSKCGNNMTFHTQEHYEYHEVYNQQPDYQSQNYRSVYQQPNYQQGYYQQSQYYTQPPRNDPGKILGIVGFCLSMACFVMSYTVAMPIAGLILSAIGLKKSKESGFNNGFAKAGLILGIIFTAITLILFTVFFALYFILIFSGIGSSYL